VDTKVTSVTKIAGLAAPGHEEACLVQIYGPMLGKAIFKFLFGGESGSIEAQYHEEIYRLTTIEMAARSSRWSCRRPGTRTPSFSPTSCASRSSSTPSSSRESASR
jgi:hypothetical protein